MPMSQQQIFNTVSKHLLKQHERAVNTDGHCQYRIIKADKTLKCAVGCLIPEEHYYRSLEGSNVRGKNVLSLLRKLNILSKNTAEANIQIALLSRLQEAHDTTHKNFEIEWPKQLREIAGVFTLEAGDI